ncbi:uncharacterized protein FTOL_02968 [Fusarium torulosum]|uniref:C2H2-type domain-containing protein n=1 Tax=Fusarium torulosum TaxID=33205 RepID=A0AAE8M3S0_9HYPO|nr:uncharacterized protein FTOL_02968 [Fusarium torulosum]
MDDSGCPQNDSLDAASEVNNQPDTAPAAQKKDSPQPPSVTVEEKDEQDVTDIKITTDDLFPSETEELLNEHKLGLDINKPHGWSGSNYDDYDVITVHGIRDNYKTAWIDSKGHWILKNQLFQHLSTREINYSYEIEQDSILYQPNGLHSLAQTLVDKYAEERKSLQETETDRPIIWVCHDLGGIIVKQALFIAAQNPAKYGNIFMHTTGLFFAGTPHRFNSPDDIEDQLHKLLLLPGPEIRNKLFAKVRHLATQVDLANQRFLTTKLFDRACIYNYFVQDVKASLAEIHPTDENITLVNGVGSKIGDLNKAVTPFSRYAHFVGHSFEASGRQRASPMSHLNLVRDEASSNLGKISKWLGSALKVSYGLIRLHTCLHSLAPPTRGLSTPFDPVIPRPPVLTWLYEQEPYLSFKKQKQGPNYLHIHGSGSPLVDISEVSRLLYAAYDSSLNGGQGSPEKAVIYFEFDRNDVRYRDISSLLTYLVDTILWHFWSDSEALAYRELTYLSDINAWTVKDLYHIYSRLRSRLASKLDLTFFISCFDQCQEDERKWFMDRILHEQTHSEASCRMIISTSSRDGLEIDRIIQGRHVNLLDSPIFAKSSENLMDEYTLDLKRLIDARPIYNNFISQIRDVLQSCNNAPELGRIILTWLKSCHRGSSKNEVAATINKLSSVTVETVINTITSTLTTSLKVKAETAIDWITHAAEPWSPEALVEALKVHMSPNQEPCLDDLNSEAEIAELEKALCGIITIENRNVKFSHPSFYRTSGPNEEESRARINSSIVTACLRYFQLEGVQKTLDEFCSARLAACSTPLDAVVVFHPRITMAEYAVRLWHRHYLASGEFKPKHLVHELFGNKQARASWEITFWLLSNPFTRSDRNYISTLPVFAMLGLEDLVGEKIISEEGQPWFNDNCWDAITEAVRSGSTRIARTLLDLVTVDAKKLQRALLCAAAQDNSEILDVLLAKTSELESFQWPEDLFHRAATMGQENVLRAMLKAGFDVNKNGIYWKACPAINAAWRGQVSSLALLLKSENKLDLSMKDFTGDDLLMVAVRVGDPDLVKLIIDAGAKLNSDTDDSEKKGMVREAIGRSAHRVVDLLLQSGVPLVVGEKKGETELELAASRGLLGCVRALLRHHEKMDAQCTTGRPLHAAVAYGHKDVVRIFLEHDPKPSMDVTPPGQNTLLIRAICTGDIDLVSFLIEHGAKIDYVDPKGDFAKTPLSRACMEGHVDMVKLLLNSKADVNYTGGESDQPLFAALYYTKTDVAKYLLKETDPDVTWRASDGMGMLHGGFNQHDVLPDLLRKGAPIDGTSIWGTVLHMAARDGCLDSIKTLLNNDPKPNLEAVVGENSANSHEIGYTALQLACAKGSFECIKLLLEAGANPHIKNRENEDLVNILLRAEPGSEDCEKALKLLLSTPYSLTVDLSRYWLHSIHKKTSVNVMRLLTKSVSDLDVRDKEGYTPLAVAVSKSNKDVAKYLIEQGAKVNCFDPTYGSILHLAVSKGDLDLVKLLLKSGADPEMVDTDYGESLVYTALGIEDSTKLYKTMRYLVEEAKVPVDRMGGKFGYAIIRAAHMTKAYPEVGTRMLKFLIRHKARLSVTDNQGRRAAHFACTSTSSDGIKALIQGGEDMLGYDTFGRLPIHFAASNPDPSCFHYLLDECNETHVKFVNTRDNDQWTPLMWAARSGSIASVHRLLSEDAECWTRSIDGGWSALKLAKFADRPPSLTEQLVPKKHSRVKQDGGEEEWEDSFHRVQPGDKKDIVCDSCLVDIIGLCWKCIECNDGFSLCFKCFAHRSDFHNPEHNFKDIGPLYQEDGSEAEIVESLGKEEKASGDEQEANSANTVEIDLDEVNLEDFDLDLEDFDLPLEDDTD